MYTFMSFATVRPKLAGAYPLDSDTSATGLEQPLIRKVCDSFEGATTLDRERCRLPSNNYITDLGLKRHFVRRERMTASVAAPRYSILYQPRAPTRSLPTAFVTEYLHRTASMTLLTIITDHVCSTTYTCMVSLFATTSQS
jgi:hypothetical protein